MLTVTSGAGTRKCGERSDSGKPNSLTLKSSKAKPRSSRSSVWGPKFQRLPGSRGQNKTQTGAGTQRASQWSQTRGSHGVEPGTTASAPPGKLSFPRQVVSGIPESLPLCQGAQHRDPETQSSRSQMLGMCTEAGMPHNLSLKPGELKGHFVKPDSQKSKA